MYTFVKSLTAAYPSLLNTISFVNSLRFCIVHIHPLLASIFIAASKCQEFCISSLEIVDKAEGIENVG